MLKQFGVFILVGILISTIGCTGKFHYLKKVSVSHDIKSTNRDRYTGFNKTIQGEAITLNTRMEQQVIPVAHRLNSLTSTNGIYKTSKAINNPDKYSQTIQLIKKEDFVKENKPKPDSGKKGLKPDGVSLAAFILGILGLFLARFLFGLLAVFHGLIVLFFKPEMNNFSKFIALAGIILGVINILMGLALL